MLDITAISKTFHPGTPNARQALRQLSLHLEDGEFATIVGSNGAGKSTLFGAIAGSFYTDEGRILLDGTDLTFQPEHRRSRVIGRLFQDPMRGTAPHMTIEENLALPICGPLTEVPSAASQPKTGSGSAASWPSWTWDWRIGCTSRWGCCPAVSGRR